MFHVIAGLWESKAYMMLLTHAALAWKPEPLPLQARHIVSKGICHLGVLLLTNCCTRTKAAQGETAAAV